ncbi:MAG: GGDEF domain-containing protein [Desulfitobacterium sp.]
MLFLTADYYDTTKPSSFLIITAIRVLFLIASISIFFISKQTKNYSSFIYLITMYEAIAAIAFLMILEQYNSLTYLSFFSLMAVTLAIYILPNKIFFCQLITIALSTLFFLYPGQKIEGLGEYDMYKIIAYQIILLIYCNINYSLTNSYKRKQFASSKELLALSVTDPLTGIYNRTKFDEEIDRWMNFSNRYGNPLSLVIFDIDDFKKVNDNYGHLVGDKVIKNIVATIKRSLRNTDIFARWGGDEFVILLPNTEVWQARELGERMCKCIRDDLKETNIYISCSLGIAILEKDDTAQSLLRRADDLLLQAKASGKNRVVIQLVDSPQCIL